MDDRNRHPIRLHRLLEADLRALALNEVRREIGGGSPRMPDSSLPLDVAEAVMPPEFIEGLDVSIRCGFLAGRRVCEDGMGVK
jgi:hypothetical protein